MKWSTRTLARGYLLFFGLYHLPHILSLLGIYETIVRAPPPFPIWVWHVILLLVYGVIPIVAAIRGSLGWYLFVAVTSFLGGFIEIFMVFTWISDMYLLLALLDFLATAFSVILMCGCFRDSLAASSYLYLGSGYPN